MLLKLQTWHFKFASWWLTLLNLPALVWMLTRKWVQHTLNFAGIRHLFRNKSPSALHCAQINACLISHFIFAFLLLKVRTYKLHLIVYKYIPSTAGKQMHLNLIWWQSQMISNNPIYFSYNSMGLNMLKLLNLFAYTASAVTISS